jgi:hypothetical protein
MDIHNEAKRELGRKYRSGPAFLSLMRARGADGAAIHLIMSNRPASGFLEMHEANRLDLTVEAVIYENWDAVSILFKEIPEFRDRTRDRLEKYGYFEKRRP